MRSEVDEILTGSFDFRIHTNPEPDIERRNDYLEAGRDAHEAEMAGFVLMKHQYPTALLAYTLNRMYPRLNAVGSITLNRSVGGLNPDAVQVVADLGAKVVWMPTVDVDTISLVDDQGELVAPVNDILAIAKARDLVLGATRSSAKDTLALFRAAKAHGVRRLVATNPTRRFNVEEIADLVSLGAYAEFTYFSHLSTGNAGEKLIADVEAIGADNCIVSTDAGNWACPPPAECMRMAIAAMLNVGMDRDDVAKVVRENPLGLVGPAAV